MEGNNNSHWGNPVTHLIWIQEHPGSNQGWLTTTAYSAVW